LEIAASSLSFFLHALIIPLNKRRILYRNANYILLSPFFLSENSVVGGRSYPEFHIPERKVKGTESERKWLLHICLRGR
jgi:hypothetical protein